MLKKIFAPMAEKELLPDFQSIEDYTYQMSVAPLLGLTCMNVMTSIPDSIASSAAIGAGAVSTLWANRVGGSSGEMLKGAGLSALAAGYGGMAGAYSVDALVVAKDVIEGGVSLSQEFARLGLDGLFGFATGCTGVQYTRLLRHELNI